MSLFHLPMVIAEFAFNAIFWGTLLYLGMAWVIEVAIPVTKEKFNEKFKNRGS
tara:strand:+ start:1823 stop:1981 length:159 start_codon:yes stop_codon:yes gene_type:complete